MVHWRRVRPFTLPALIAAGVAAVILGSGCTAVPKAPINGAGDHKLELFTAAKSGGTDPFLTIDKKEESALSFALGPTGPTVTPLMDALDGRGTAITLRMGKPLEQDMYMNLSKAIRGSLFWKSTASQAGAGANGGTETEYVRLRAVLWLGDKRVGGDEFLYDSAYYDRATEWTSMDLYFRSELPLLPKGETLSLVITRIGGWNDIQIGTGGAVRSQLDLHYFNYDPVACGVEIKNGKWAPSLECDVPPEDPSLAGLAWIPVLGALGALRRGRATLVVLIVLATALAGCAAKKADTTASPAPADGVKPPVETKVEKDEELAKKGVGAVRGRIKNYDNNADIPGASVFMLGVTNTAQTDRYGKYHLGEVTAGSYLLRADKETYLSKEVPDVKVNVGEITIINIFLRHPPEYGEDAHTHNDYLDADVLDIWTGNFRMGATQAQLSDVQGESYCASGYSACTAPIVLPPNKYIPAGTGLVEVTLAWNTDEDAPREIGLEVQTASNKTLARFIPRGSGDPFRIAIFPHEADPGHAKMSYWTFRAFVNADTLAYNVLHDELLAISGPIGFKVRTHRSVIPLEPKHEDFWGTKTQLPIFKDATAAYTCIGCLLPSDASGYSWIPGAKVFIPPGTDRLEGRLEWVQQYTAQGTPVVIPLNTVDWNVLYKPANVPPSMWSTGLKVVTDVQRGAGYMTFKIKPSELETDQYYQRTSNWKFYMDDDLDGQNHEGIYTYFELTLTAYKKA